MCQWRTPLICLSLVCLALHSGCADSDEPQPVAATEPATEPATESVSIDGSFPRLLGDHFDGRAVGQVALDWSSKPQVAWTLPVGAGYGLGSAVNGVYYQLDAEARFQGGVEQLRALDFQSGKELWKAERKFSYQDLYGYDNGPRGTPTVAGDRIVTFGVDGMLCCRQLTNGDLIWKVNTKSKYGVVQNFFGVGASPLIHDSLVIVPVGGSPEDSQQVAPGRLDRIRSNDTAVVAFDLQTGEERWHCGEDFASYSSPRTATIDGKTVVLQLARNQLLVIDPDDGKVLWQYPHRASILESVNASMPVVKQDEVFISECYQVGSALLQVRLDGPTPVWVDPPSRRREQAMRCHWSTPVLVGDYLYGCSGRNNPDSEFRCVQWSTGKVMWGDASQIRTSVATADGKLVVLSEDGVIEILQPNPERKQVLHRYDFGDQLKAPCWSAPIIVGNRMLIRGDEKVLCLSVAAGSDTK